MLKILISPCVITTMNGLQNFCVPFVEPGTFAIPRLIIMSQLMSIANELRALIISSGDISFDIEGNGAIIQATSDIPNTPQSFDIWSLVDGIDGSDGSLSIYIPLRNDTTLLLVLKIIKFKRWRLSL